MPPPKGTVRIFVESDLAEGAAVSLSSTQSHYVTRVMRGRTGDLVALFNGRDGEWRGRIEKTAKNSCTVIAREQIRYQPPDSDLWLAFAPVKKARTDFIVEKATELGATRLLPTITARSETKRINRERLAANALEAAQQCRRLSVPVVAEPVSLDVLLDAWPLERPLFVLDETGRGEPIREAISQAAGKDKGGNCISVGFLVGPEGGFKGSELDAMNELAFVTRVGVGPRILRSETAVVSALACWQALAGDWIGIPD